MSIKLYHGSEKIIRNPEYGKGNVYNDYGRAFYCTQSIDLAKEWAVDRNRDGYCNEYFLRNDDLSFLDLSDDKYCILHWLTILLCNRTFDNQTDFAKEAKKYLLDNFWIDYETYDLIKGYRADDSYFSFAQDFINNAISIDTLKRAMVLGKLGEQLALKSEKAFESIEYVGNIFVPSDDYYAKKQRRDSTARQEYFKMRQEPWVRGNIYMMQIIDEGITKDDARLR